MVDIDVKDGHDGHTAWRALTAAGILPNPNAVVATPGGGFHAYYQGTRQGNGSLRDHGIDYRGAGGYVLAPPSVVNGRSYVLTSKRPCAGAVVDWAVVRRHLVPPRPTPPRPARHDDHAALVAWVAGHSPGGRNNALFWAACKAVETGADGTVLGALVAAATTTGLPRDEAERTVRSAYRRAGTQR